MARGTRNSPTDCNVGKKIHLDSGSTHKKHTFGRSWQNLRADMKTEKLKHTETLNCILKWIRHTQFSGRLQRRKKESFG